MIDSLKRGLVGWLTAFAIVECGTLAWAQDTVTYTYDELGRIIRAKYPDGKRITYTYDATGNRTQQAVSVNQAPFADGDLTSLNLTFGNIAVLDPRANDTDPDGDLLTIVGKTDGMYGTVTIEGGGTTLRYTYTANYQAEFLFEEITYTISDGGGGTSTASVTIDISPSCNPSQGYWPPSPPC